ncbi:MAG: hypothetical protein ACOY16_09220 [Chloroflexota bacterium]
MPIEKSRLEDAEFRSKLAEFLESFSEAEIDKTLAVKREAERRAQIEREQAALEAAYTAEARQGHKSLTAKLLLREKYKAQGLGCGMTLAEWEARKAELEKNPPKDWRTQIREASQGTLRTKFEAELRGARSKTDVSLILSKYRSYGLEDTTLPDWALSNRVR